MAEAQPTAPLLLPPSLLPDKEGLSWCRNVGEVGYSRVPGLTVMGEDVAPGVFQGVVLQLGGGELSGPV